MRTPIIDEVAIERAMRGDRTVTLTNAERHKAMALLDAKGRTSRDIADLLGIAQRTVHRNRAARGDS